MPLPQEVPGTSFAHSALAKAHFVAPSLPQGEAGGGRGSGWAALTTYPPVFVPSPSRSLCVIPNRTCKYVFLQSTWKLCVGADR